MESVLAVASPLAHSATGSRFSIHHGPTTESVVTCPERIISSAEEHSPSVATLPMGLRSPLATGQI